MNKKIKIADIPFDPVTYGQAIERVSDLIKKDKKVYITTPNPEMVLEADRNKEFEDILKNSSLSIPDGIGILWASYYLSLPLPKNKLIQYLQFIKSLFAILFTPKKIRKVLPARVTGTDLFERMIDESQKHKWRVFLLGAKPGVAHKAINSLLKKYPKAIFAGSHSGSPSLNEENEICEIINISKPDILFVAYGSPAQELWIKRNLSGLHTVKVAVGIGGAFDFAAGEVKRAPVILQKIGLEWLWRLIQEPKRKTRIKNATLIFIKYIYNLKNVKKIEKM